MVRNRQKICSECGHILSITDKHKKAISEAQKKRHAEAKEALRILNELKKQPPPQVEVKKEVNLSTLPPLIL